MLGTHLSFSLAFMPGLTCPIILFLFIFSFTIVIAIIFFLMRELVLFFFFHFLTSDGFYVSSSIFRSVVMMCVAIALSRSRSWSMKTSR